MLSRAPFAVWPHPTPPLAGAADGSSDWLPGNAERLFEETITNDAVITEDRLSVAEVVREIDDSVDLPSSGDCYPQEREAASVYAWRMAPLFGAPEYPPVDIPEQWSTFEPETVWALQAGHWVRTQPLFHYLLQATEQTVVIWHELIAGLSRTDFGFREVGDFAAREQVRFLWGASDNRRRTPVWLLRVRALPCARAATVGERRSSRTDRLASP